MEQKQVVQIEGIVEAVTFCNEDNGFTVLELDRGGDELLTVVGEMFEVHAGEKLTLHGCFASHPTYGYQFKVSAYERAMPQTETAIERYLASGAIKGIGPVLAGRLVGQFGEATLEIMEKQPGRLTEVKGISPKKVEEIMSAFSRMYGIRLTMMFLSQFHLDSATAIQVWKKWGNLSRELIEKNPFILCCDEIGLDFQQCDEMADALQIDKQSKERIAAAITFVLRHNHTNGHTCLPVDKLLPTVCRLIELEEDLILPVLMELVEQKQLIRTTTQREYLYLPWMYEAESYVASRLRFMLMTNVSSGKNYQKEIDKLEQQNDIQYAARQREAIAKALDNNIFILTGGPGTGKTTTINAIISLLEQEGRKVCLTAPTGRAAKRMAEVTGREGKTIHRLLEVDFKEQGAQRFKRDEKNPLPFDAVIVDETSMVDILLMQSLIRALKMGCKLILVGDSDQLPSVGAGNVLRDLIDSQTICYVELTEIFRQAAESLIVTNAHAIVHGELPVLERTDKDFFFMKRYDYQQMLDTVVALCGSRLPKTYGYSPIEDIQVIAPTRIGEVGTVQLNKALQKILNPPDKMKDEYLFEGRLFRLGDKVMQIKNNYDIIWTRQSGEQGMGVFNGDIGMIELIDRPSKSMLIRYEDRTAEYTLEQLSEIEHAYAITVHKSQGSEFAAVVMPLMHYKSKMHYRNLLYTAVTRAKSLLVICGMPQTIQQMVENDRKTVRYTLLTEFLVGE